MAQVMIRGFKNSREKTLALMGGEDLGLAENVQQLVKIVNESTFPLHRYFWRLTEGGEWNVCTYEKALTTLLHAEDIAEEKKEEVYRLLFTPR